MDAAAAAGLTAPVSRPARPLEQLKLDFPQRAAAITIRRGEANAVLRALCAESWRGRRAVVFLDPYGMQVDWTTIEAIARTKAIDLWILFPLEIGVNRLLMRSGQIRPGWRERLDRVFGTTDWYDRLYVTRPEKQGSLFGPPEEVRDKAAVEAIGAYFVERLETVFAGVAPKPVELRNSRGQVLFLLCFAAANPTGAKVAVPIANHLMKKLNEAG